MQDLFNKVNLDSFKLEDFNFNILEVCYFIKKNFVKLFIFIRNAPSQRTFLKRRRSYF